MESDGFDDFIQFLFFEIETPCFLLRKILDFIGFWNTESVFPIVFREEAFSMRVEKGEKLLKECFCEIEAIETSRFF